VTINGDGGVFAAENAAENGDDGAGKNDFSRF
jgi:hypothetical protein